MAQWTGATIAQPVDATIIGRFDPPTQLPAPASTSGSRPSAPVHPSTPLPATDGAVALEPKPSTETVAPGQPGTLSGRASTQVPASTPATPVPSAAQAKSQPPAPAPAVHPPTPIPSKSHPSAPVAHPSTPLPTAPVPVVAPPVVARPPAPAVPAAPAGRQARATPPPQMPPPARPVEPSRPEPSGDGGAGSKMPIFAGGAVLVVLAAVGIYLLTRPEAVPPPPPPETTQQVVDPSIARHVAEAERALAGRSFAKAIEQANLALQKDPQNAGARGVLEQAQAAQKKIEASVADVRRAMDAKDVAGASRALEELMRQDPSHPSVPPFREALNGAFRSRAEQAQTEMKQAQRAATQAKATSQAEFKAAILTGREAEALLARNEFVNATQKFYQARDGFDRAYQAQSTQLVPTAVPLPSPVAVATTSTTLAPAPTTTTLPARTPAPTTTTLPAPPATVNEEPAIRRLIADFERAFETGDVALWKSIRLGAAEAELKSVGQKNWKQVNITIESIDVLRTRAIVRISRKDIGADGKTYPFAQTLTLMKEPSGWKITSLGR